MLTAFFLYGAGELGAMALEALKFLNTTIVFVDRNSQRFQGGYKGKPVISPSEMLRKRQVAKSIVIITI